MPNAMRIFRFNSQEREVIIEALLAFHQSRLLMNMDFPEIVRMTDRVRELSDRNGIYELRLRGQDDYDVVCKALDETVIKKKENKEPYDRTLDILLKAYNAPTPRELREQCAQAR